MIRLLMHQTTKGVHLKGTLGVAIEAQGKRFPLGREYLLWLLMAQAKKDDYLKGDI